MYDPHRDPRNTYGGALAGISAAFIPMGAVGILIGAVIVLLLGIATGTIGGPWLFVAIGAVVVLVALIPRAIKAEMKREDRRALRNDTDGSLPEDSQISDDERREAMRQYRDDRTNRK